MKIFNSIKGAVLCFLAFSMAFAFTACEDEPDKYEIAKCYPTIHYIRKSDVASKDSLLTGAYMGQSIAIVGENLRSITQLFFNDQEAILNTSYMTDNVIIVNVPNTLSDNPTNKIYMVTSGKDTLDYDFMTLVPAPNVASISNEWAKAGEEVTIYGDFLLDYPSSPLKVTMPGNVEISEFTNISKTAVSFIVPQGTEPGYINVETMYGKGRSKFYFRDDRCMLFDWDGTHGKALATGCGWRDGSKVIQSSYPGIEPLDGRFVVFAGHQKAEIGGTWDEDGFCFNYWPDPANGFPELSSIADFTDVANLCLKFEINVPQGWASSALQIIFSGNSQVTNATGNNNYYSDPSVPRAVWAPWHSADGGVYTTKGWQTVTIPLSDFCKSYDGSNIGANISNFTGLTFFVWNGPYEGQECDPVIAIDNIRISPIGK